MTIFIIIAELKIKKGKIINTEQIEDTKKIQKIAEQIEFKNFNAVRFFLHQKNMTTGDLKNIVLSIEKEEKLLNEINIKEVEL